MPQNEESVLAFLKKFASNLVKVGKTIEGLIDDNTLTVEEKQQQARDLFSNHVYKMVNSELKKAKAQERRNKP